MYESYWGMGESPFQHHSPTRWFYESPIHEEALARMFFLIENRRRFGLLQGSAGTGKTMLFGVLAAQVTRSQRQLVHLDLTGLDADELTWQLALGLEASPCFNDSPRSLWHAIEDQLRGLRAARVQTVFLLDHLDGADDGCTKLLRRLYQFDAAAGSTATFLAAGRSTAVAAPGESSITAAFLQEASELRVELLPWGVHETGTYLQTLCARAGSQREIFTAPAIELIHRESDGVPRFISRLAHLSLLAAMMDNRDHVDAETVASTLGELPAAPRTERPSLTAAPA